MIPRFDLSAMGLLVSAVACGNVLGIDDSPSTVQCTKHGDCSIGEICVAHQCSSPGAGGGSPNGGKGGDSALPGNAGRFVSDNNVNGVGMSGGVGEPTGTLAGAGSATAVGGSATAVGLFAQGGTDGRSSTAFIAVHIGGFTDMGGTMTLGGMGGSPSTNGPIAYTGGAPMSAGACGASSGIGGTSARTSSAAGGWGTSNAGAKASMSGGPNGGPNGGALNGATGSTRIEPGATAAGAAGVAAFAEAAGAPARPGCVAGEHRCHVYDKEQAPGFPQAWQTCQADGTWNDGELCPGHCSPDANGCALAPSCRDLNSCHFGKSCCNSLPLPGGSFARSQILDAYGDDLCTDDNPCPATVGPFMLDTFEVTVGRFRNFVSAYSRDMIPAGSGKNPHNATDPGWDVSWNELLPNDAGELVQRIGPASCAGGNYTDEPGENDFEPVNCVDWFLAVAFCIWDQGRLPSETEWDYAASGAERRLYPWSVPPGSNLIGQDYAVYGDKTHLWTSPHDVGTAELGVSKWGQFDLAGNLFEWLIDADPGSYDELDQCNDCASYDWSSTWSRCIRGGSYATDASVAEVPFRTTRTADLPWNRAGLRCARDH